MTINDLCPGLDQVEPRDQIIEVLTRLRSGIALLDASRHLVPLDREKAKKCSDYADLLRDLILAGAGTTQPNGEHAKLAPAPLCENRHMKDGEIYCASKDPRAGATSESECRECMEAAQ